MRVFRLECPDGRGPYRSNSIPYSSEGYNLLAENYGAFNNPDCPSAYTDFPQVVSKFFNNADVCGCPSKKALAKWFRRKWSDLKPVLKEANFKVIEYSIRKSKYVAASEHQVIFDRTKAKKVQELPVEALDPLVEQLGAI